MFPNKNVQNFAEYLVFHYSKINSFGERSLSQNDIPDFDLDHLCAIISSNHKNYASEACGPDNEYFYKDMLPALNQFMSNSLNKDYEVDFLNTWKTGIRKYYSNTIDDLLVDALMHTPISYTDAA